MLRFFSPLIFSLLIVSCSPVATPEKALATAYRYAQLEWMPEERHVRHGDDSNGIEVHTPDRGLARYGDSRGYWEPGKAARGMPYKWGGFDTPESFEAGLRKGKKAGDVGSPAKRKLGLEGVSGESVGVDCSGFVSRCWRLQRQYSTWELPEICVKLGSWDELRAGDILLKKGHVILFEKWSENRREIVGYEAGPLPKWRVNACGILKSRLLAEGYEPWRYRKMLEPRNRPASNLGNWEWGSF